MKRKKRSKNPTRKNLKKKRPTKRNLKRRSQTRRNPKKRNKQRIARIFTKKGRLAKPSFFVPDVLSVPFCPLRRITSPAQSSPHPRIIPPRETHSRPPSTNKTACPPAWCSRPHIFLPPATRA